MSKKKQESLFWGVVLVLLGVVFLLESMNISVWRYLAEYWPVFLIIIGLKNIFQHFSAKKQFKEERPDYPGQS